MKIADMAKKNFERGLWTVEMVAALVAKGKLTAEEYREITGETYAE